MMEEKRKRGRPKGSKHSEEAKRKMSEQRKGHSHTKGVPKSEEHKKSISEALKEKWQDQDWREKMVESFKRSWKERKEATN